MFRGNIQATSVLERWSEDAPIDHWTAVTNERLFQQVVRVLREEIRARAERLHKERKVRKGHLKGTGAVSFGSAASAAARARETRAALKRKLGREPTPEEWRKEMGVSRWTLYRIRRANGLP